MGPTIGPDLKRSDIPIEDVCGMDGHVLILSTCSSQARDLSYSRPLHADDRVVVRVPDMI